MKHKELISRIKEKYKKIDRILNNVILDFDPGDIHLFRLEVKKLRSLLRFSCAAKKKPLNIPKKLRAFYRTLGVVRSLQIQLQSIKNIPPTGCYSLQKSYPDFITREIEGKLASAKKMVTRKNPFAKEKHALLSRLPNGIRQKAIRRFTTQHVSRLAHLMQPAYLPDESLHRIRKLLKDILYTWPLTAERTALPSTIIMSKEEVHAITEILGNFQDTCTRLDLLHAHYKRQQLSLNQRLAWRTLENHWWQEKELDRENIHKLFQKESFSQILLTQSTFMLPPRVFIL